MKSIEIIGAVIDDGLVTSDPYVIDASIALGRQIEYLSREEARELPPFCCKRSIGVIEATS